MSDKIFILMLAAAGAIIVVGLIKSGHFIKLLLLNALSGTAALFAVRFIGEIIGTNLPLNVFTFSVGAVGGTPGVIYLLLMDVLCRI